MGKEELKGFIDNLLLSKFEKINSKIELLKNELVKELESLEYSDDDLVYDIPEDLVKVEKQGGDIDLLHEYVKKISHSVNQTGLITNLLEGINNFCKRAALFIVREDKLVGWRGKGFSNAENEVSDSDIKKIFFSMSADTILKDVIERRDNYFGDSGTMPDDHLIYSRFGGIQPKKIFVLPFFVKGKPQAVIYTDGDSEEDIGTKEIEILASVGELSLDLLPFRQKILSRVKTKEFIDEKIGDNLEVETPENITPAKTIKLKPAERYAKVLIEDIILYNKDKVEKALAEKKLFKVLRTTIEQAKEQYLMKYEDLSYFEKMLVDKLAKGDKEALKGYDFETL